MNSVNIKICDTVEDAPNYKKMGGYTSLSIGDFVIVGQGRQSGRPTIDVLLTDDEGKRYVAMITGTLVEMLCGALKGFKERTGVK